MRRGDGPRARAWKFACSESSVRRVKQGRRGRGEVAPKVTRQRSHERGLHAEWPREKTAHKPDSTLLELVALAAAEHGWKTSDATICRALEELRLTPKRDARRGRAGPRRRRLEASARGRVARSHRPRSRGLPRRDLGEDQPDADPRPQRKTLAADREDAPWPAGRGDVHLPRPRLAHPRRPRQTLRRGLRPLRRNPTRNYSAHCGRRCA